MPVYTLRMNGHNFEMPEDMGGEDSLTPSEAKEKEVEQVLAQIGFIKQQVAALGANDFELPRLDEITEKLRAGELTPLEAGKLANEVFESKSAYH